MLSLTENYSDGQARFYLFDGNNRGYSLVPRAAVHSDLLSRQRG